MHSLSHDLFLLMVNLSQLNDEQLVIKLFQKSISQLFNTTASFVKENPNTGFKVQTTHNQFGWLTTSKSLTDEEQTHIQNAVQMLAVILERLHQQHLLKRDKKSLQFQVDEKTAHLEASQETFRAIAQNTPDIILRLDADLRFVFINNQIKYYTGAGADAFINNNFTDSTLPLNGSTQLHHAARQVRQSGNLYAVITKQHFNGKIFFLEWRFFPEYTKDEEIAGILGTAKDISKEKHYEDELIAAKKRAEQADKLKSAFLSNMSHEIRTPLNAILGFSDLITRKDLNKEEKNGYVAIIKENSNHLLSAIDELLDLSKIESGEINLTREPFNINRFVNELYIENQAKIENQQKAITLLMESTDELKDEHIQTDRRRLKQALNYIIDNAIKFTPEGQIGLTCGLNGDKLQFDVVDTGIGIPKEKQGIIFERFRQVDETLTRKFGGNGLGLAIAKGFINLLNGTISVESEVGEGSAFTVEIPWEPYNT